jgi:undecaprenyl diphosphate synthase
MAMSAAEGPTAQKRRGATGASARYVAIIADGNRRWARERGLPVQRGHEAGVDVAMQRVHDAIEFGIAELTTFVFSTENWRRPGDEVSALMDLFAGRIHEDTPDLSRRGVRVRFIGAREALSAELHREMRWAEDLTAANERITLFVAMNYGGRAEILEAARRYKGGGEAAWRRCLYARDMHDPDIIIRTGGDRRLSNYLLWQAAYSELVFRDEYWPEFNRRAFEESLAEAGRRERRFGADRLLEQAS